ncbi:DUF421 domain-containing protein [Clostridium sediminicola]|uniref:DUF421 domain-containing protein n=1 Tax=Clostridium sediminicola TaxID=3114879 RepID=UPI0031F25C97
MDINAIFFEAEELGILELVLRTTILHFILYASAKLMGFRQPGITTPYNFLMAAGISHIAASRMINPHGRVVDAAAIIAVYTLLNLVISYMYFKLPTIVSQKPIIIVKNGKLIKENLSKVQLTIDNLFSILRQNNSPNIDKVEYLIAEATGDYSVAIDNNSLPITKQEMGIETQQDILPQILIYEGKVDKKILKENGLNQNWIDKELKLREINNMNDVFLGILTSDKKLFIN